MVAGKQQFNIWLPPDLVKRVKHASVDAEVSLSVFVEEAIEGHLARLADDDEGSSS